MSKNGGGNLRSCPLRKIGKDHGTGLLQARFAQVGRPACVLCEDFTFRANRPVNHLQIELRVKPENLRRLCPCGIVVTEFNIVNSKINVGPKNIRMNSQENACRR